MATACLCAVLVFGPATRRSLRAYAEIRVSQVPPAAGRAHSFAVAQLMDMHGGYWAVLRAAGMHVAPAATDRSDPGNVITVAAGDEEVVLGPTQARRMQAVTSHALIDLPVRVSLARQDLDLLVTIRNQTSWLVRDLFYVDRERYQHLGEVPAGQTREVRFPAELFMTGTTMLAPEWIAASVGAVARREDRQLDERQRQALSTIVAYALTPDASSYLPWGEPFIVGIVAAPVTPPLRGGYSGAGYHFLVIPLAGLSP